jgi:O-antigen/teichoic acid export membrane protein
MVSGFIGTEANGIYAVSYKVPTFLTLLSTVFMQAWQFSAVSESENDKGEHIDFFSKVWSSFQSVMFLAGWAIVAFSVPVIKILTTPDYYSAWKFIPLLAASMIFNSFANFMGSVYVVEKRSKNSFLTAMLGAVLNIILNFLLIPTALGVQGAAIATFISYFAIFIIRAINVQKYIPFKLYMPQVLLNTAVILLQSAFMIFSLPFNIPVQVVCAVLLIIINYKFIMVFVDKFFSFFKTKRRIK